MEKVTFKFGLVLGFLITINVANIANVFYNTVIDGDLFWVLMVLLLLFWHLFMRYGLMKSYKTDMIPKSQTLLVLDSPI